MPVCMRDTHGLAPNPLGQVYLVHMLLLYTCSRLTIQLSTSLQTRVCATFQLVCGKLHDVLVNVHIHCTLTLYMSDS